MRVLSLLIIPLIGAVGQAQTGPAITKINYGALFLHEGLMATSDQFWQHTFEILLPDPLYDLLPSINSTQARHMTVCHMHNIYVRYLNDISDTVTREISDTYIKAIQVLKQPKRTNRGSLRQNGTERLRSRSKRSILPFVGDVAGDLFGLVTEDQINGLVKHINEIYKQQQNLAFSEFANVAKFMGYMAKTNKRMHNLMEAITDNHEQVTRLNQIASDSSADLELLESDLTTFVPIMLKRETAATQISHQLQAFLLGLHELVQRKLPPSLVPAHELKNAIETIETELHKTHPNFHVSNKHPAFYYQSRDVLFARKGKSFLVTISVPISSNQVNLDVYQIRTVPVPFNHTTTHVTEVQNLPDYIAVSHDKQCYLEMSYADYTRCKGVPIKHCPTLLGIRSIDRPTCAAAILFDRNPTKFCSFTVKEDGLTPFLLEVSSGVALLSNIQELIFTCNNRVQKHEGCQMCEIHIPCGCAASAQNFHIPPRVTNCVPMQTKITRRYPVNLALLAQFFNESDISHITSSSSFQDPPPIHIPQLRILNSKFAKEKKLDKRLEADLSTVAKNMKLDKPVFRDSPWLGPLEWDNGSLTIAHLLAYVAFGFSVVLAGATLVIFRKLRALCLLIAMTTNSPLAGVQANHTTMHTPLFWNNLATSPTQTSTLSPVICDQLIPNHALLALELFTLALILIFLIRSGLGIYHTLLYRSDVYLEINNGKCFVEIYLTSLTYCPTEYDLTFQYWVYSLSLIKRMVGTDDLLISWPQFALHEKRTDQLIPLPKTVRLTRFQWYRVRNIIKDQYTVYPKIVHGGRAIYITKSNKPTEPTVDFNSAPPAEA